MRHGIAWIAAASSAALLLAGCTAERRIVTEPACPPSFVRYAPDDQKAVAALWPGLAPVVRMFLTDYGRVRAELRAAGCREG